MPIVPRREPPLPTSVTACIVYADDAPGIVREAVAAAKEGFRVALNAEQVGILNSWAKAMQQDARLDQDEE